MLIRLVDLPPGLGITLHVAVAMFLGWLVGFERYFHGRAAGTQVYCFVCMTSCAVVVVGGYPTLWYGGQAAGVAADPFPVIGPILTGIGFLGAGLIVKNGMSIRGLTTAASIWASSGIGILTGVGFYSAACAFTLLFLLCTTIVPKIERLLPSFVNLQVTLRYAASYRPKEDAINAFLHSHGMEIEDNSLTLNYEMGTYVMEFGLVTSTATKHNLIARLSEELPELPHISSFAIAHSSRA